MNPSKATARDFSAAKRRNYSAAWSASPDHVGRLHLLKAYGIFFTAGAGGGGASMVIDKFMFYRYGCVCGWEDTTNYARNEDALEAWRRHAYEYERRKVVERAR